MNSMARMSNKGITAIAIFLCTSCSSYLSSEHGALTDDPLGEALPDAEQDSLLTHCPEQGKVINADTNAQCCWPGQSWSVLQWRCVGIPRCPAGLVIAGDDCSDPTIYDENTVAKRAKGRRTLDMALGEARECVVQNDQDCCLRALRGVKRTRRVVQILLSCYHQSGRRDAACELAKHHPNIRRARSYSVSSCSNKSLATARETICLNRPSSKLDLSPVIEAYKQNDLDEAISLGFALAVGSDLEADRERAMRLARKLDRLATVRRELSADAETSLPQTISRLEELLLLDQMISGGHFSSRIIPELRTAYLTRAKRSWRNGNQMQACQCMVKAYKLAPESFSEPSIAAKCERSGQELYKAGLKARPSDLRQAKSYWRKVLSMLPETSPWYRKAYVRLNNPRGSKRAQNEM